MKWLIIRYSAIGDCVMAARVPSRIRREYPDAQIEWAVEDRCLAVVDTERLCQCKHVFRRNMVKSRNMWSSKKWREMLRFFGSIRDRDYDFGIDLQGHSKTALCLRIAKPKRRVAIRATDLFAKALNPVMEPVQQKMHSVDLALCALSHLIDSDASHEPIMPSLAKERRHVKHMVPDGPPVAAIAVGATKLDKIYSSTNWAEVAEGLNQAGYRVVFVGAAHDQPPQVPGTLDLAGKLTLAQSMAVIAESAVTIAADTGAGHIAAAYGVPVVSIFGPTDPFVFRPYTDQGVVLRCGSSPNDVPPADVVEAVLSLAPHHAPVLLR